MKIAIIGTGNMATGFARQLAPKHEVWIGSRDTERGKQTADQTGATGGGSYSDVIADAELVILGVPWMAMEETVGQLGDLSGKVVIDISNPYTEQGLIPLEGTSTAEEVQKWAKGAAVVKGWNHVFDKVLEKPEIGGVKQSVLIAGDDEKAKETVFGLARDMGFEPFDAGPLEATRSLERLVGAIGGLNFWPDGAIHVLKP